MPDDPIDPDPPAKPYVLEITNTMPITSLNSYLPTLQEFINHWTQVNTELGAGGPLTLLGAYPVATLTTDRTALDTLMTAVTAADNAWNIARADMDIKRAALVVRLKQFRGACTAYMPGSSYQNAPPRLPATGSIIGKYLTAFDDMANLWTQINATPPTGFTGPLTLGSTYTLATFNTDLAALRTSATAYSAASQNATIARDKRNLLMATLVQRLKQYRGAAIAKLTAGSALIASIPALTAPSGSTPKPVRLSAVWDTDHATLTWTPSDNANLDYYSFRYHPGPRYKAAEEQAVDTTVPGITTFETDFGLVASGAVAWFKVYVVTTTGNEKGSAAVKVIRP